ncbi:MAG TPA: DUF3467 domain-containing protein [Bryobacteraceae bacterium]|nr:DUF3467 domain-containing protein [Bryobacteraceae bacterium]
MESDKPETQSSLPAELPEGSVKELTITIPFPDSFTYSNVSAISSSFMDFRISFAETMVEDQPRARVGIVMPPEHAAQLVLTLITQLDYFEKNFGEVRHPAWRTAKAKLLGIKTPA